MIPTPFHSRTAPLCHSWAWEEWAGYIAAQMYELEHTHEYHAVRTATAMFDFTPLQKYHLHGPDAEKLLDRVLTRNVTKCQVGQIVYSAWCDDEGKILNDGTLSRLGRDSFRLAANDPNLAWLEDNAPDMVVKRGTASEPGTPGLAGLAVLVDLIDRRFVR